MGEVAEGAQSLAIFGTSGATSIMDVASFVEGTPLKAVLAAQPVTPIVVFKIGFENLASIQGHCHEIQSMAH